jgi:hypothetical protein
VPASFDATLTSDTLLHRAATFPELHGVTKAPTRERESEKGRERGREKRRERKR